MWITIKLCAVKINLQNTISRENNDDGLTDEAHSYVKQE
jgi:hypothetical protein